MVLIIMRFRGMPFTTVSAKLSQGDIETTYIGVLYIGESIRSSIFTSE